MYMIYMQDTTKLSFSWALPPYINCSLEKLNRNLNIRL